MSYRCSSALGASTSRPAAAPAVSCSRRPPGRQALCVHAILGRKGNDATKAQQVVSVSPADPMSPISGEQLPANVCFGATGAALVGAAGLVVYFLRARVKRPAVVEEPDADLQPLHSTDDPQHHARVLAKTRQAAHISNAVAYTKAGEPSKAVLELNKALAANSICRTTAVVVHSKEELTGLYRLHLLNTPQPPEFSTLLQLQEMLGINAAEAESLENEVLRSPGSFAI